MIGLQKKESRGLILRIFKEERALVLKLPRKDDRKELDSRSGRSILQPMRASSPDHEGTRVGCTPFARERLSGES